MENVEPERLANIEVALQAAKKVLDEYKADDLRVDLEAEYGIEPDAFTD